MDKINIAIDGFSSCGKSTLAKQLAKEIKYVYVDSGAMYRAVTLFAMREDLFNDLKLDEEALKERIDEVHVKLVYDSLNDQQVTYLNDENVEEEIRKMPVSQRVSQVAVVKEVRDRMVFLQQEMAKDKGVVMDGRDIGTVVLPNAELKIFMTASPDVRAQRRMDELIAKGEQVTLEEIKQNLTHRDHIDQTREESPLRQAEDARVLDNSNLTRAEQLDLVKSWIVVA
ncbi:(d)CMP kinase [bacterium SCSIO 12643]|nr:(d)CMP kinase [bacterium SCSIO 12643]